MSSNPGRAAGRSARKTGGGAKAWPITVAVLLLLVGAWAIKTLALDGGQAKNILLLGVDENQTRTDVVILAHVDPNGGLVNLVSVPRDTWVEIPCDGIKVCQSPDKLAHAHAWGGDQGPELAVKTVQKFLGVPIDGYMRVNFAGFRQLIDEIGGVDIVIDQNMDYEDPTPPGLSIHFKASKSPQHLNGQQALEYVRFRNDGQGDIGRTERTRKFLKAVLDAMRKDGVAARLPTLAKALGPYMKTNLDAGTLAMLARVAPKIDPAKVQMAMVPGTAVILKSGPWVWQADEPGTQKIVNAMIKGIKPDGAPSDP